MKHPASIPSPIIERMRENIEVYGLCRSDAFEEAVKCLSKPGSRLYKSWKTCALYPYQATAEALIFAAERHEAYLAFIAAEEARNAASPPEVVPF